MRRAVKVAISLPEEIFQAAEREREARRESRSEFYRIAVEAFLRRQREREAVNRYVRGYRDLPESEDEIAAARSASARLLELEPWE